MIANWAFAPVSGFDYWRVIVTSPEVMIFLFFMITDPKTVPAGRVGRVIFGFLVAVMSTLLMAPQVDEFGTKVGLLAGLVVMCAARPILDRLLPEPRSTSDEIGMFAPAGSRWAATPASSAASPASAMTLGLVLVLGVGIVAAGTPARGVNPVNMAEVLDRVPHEIDPATFPSITVGKDVTDWNHAVAGDGRAGGRADDGGEPGAREPGAAAARRHASSTAVDHGDRLDEMQGRLQEASATGTTVDRPLPVRRHRHVAGHAVRQAGRPEPRPRRDGHDDRGDVRRVRHADLEPGRRRSRSCSSCGGPRAARWLNVGGLPPRAGS